MITFKDYMKLEITKTTGRLLIPASILKSDNEFKHYVKMKVGTRNGKVYFIPEKNFDKVDLDADSFDLIKDNKIDKQGKISVSAKIVKELELTSKDYMLTAIDNQYIIMEEI